MQTKQTTVRARRRLPIGVIICTVLLVILACAMSMGLFLYTMAKGAVVPVGVVPEDPGTGEGRQVFEYTSNRTRKENVHTFLLGGTDKDGYRTDAMLLVYFAPDEGVLNIMQIPRDLFVETGGDSRKANALYAYGRGPLMVSVMSETLGIEIDHYIVINLSCFRQLVDQLGGVTVNVPVNMDYEDPYQDLSIHLTKGEHTLNGKQAEGFVRFRYGYADMDIGRMKAQQIFISAMAKTVLEPSNALKIPGLISTVFDNMRTDVTVNSMLAYATQALKLSMEDVRLFTMPSESWYDKGESGLTAYRAETLYMISNYFNPYVGNDILVEGTLQELGRTGDADINLHGRTLVEIDENHPKFYVNPSWDWQSYLSAQQGEQQTQVTEEVQEGTEPSSAAAPSTAPATGTTSAPTTAGGTTAPSTTAPTGSSGITEPTEPPRESDDDSTDSGEAAPERPGELDSPPETGSTAPTSSTPATEPPSKPLEELPDGL